MSETTRGVILFDGDCGICNGGVRTLIKLDRQKRILYAPLQGETAAAIIERHDELNQDLDTMVYVRGWETASETPYLRSTAIIEACRDIGGWKKLAVCLKILPCSWRDGFYNWVARNRHRWSHAACELSEQRQNQERVLP